MVLQKNMLQKDQVFIYEAISATICGVWLKSFRKGVKSFKDLDDEPRRRIQVVFNQKKLK